MNTGPTTIVQRGGFFTAIAWGFFSLLIIIVVCAAGIGVYGLNIVDRKVTQIFHIGQGIIHSLPEVTEALPPALSDLFEDCRKPQYRSQLTIDASTVPHAYNDDLTRLVLKVSNDGPSVVTLLALRAALVDEDGTPKQSTQTYLATPVMADSNWPGPLMPGSTRRVSILFSGVAPSLTPEVEVADLRVWNEDPEPPELTDTD